MVDELPHETFLRALRRTSFVRPDPPDLDEPEPDPDLDDPTDTRVKVGILTPSCGIGGAEFWMLALMDHCDGSLIRWKAVTLIAGASEGHDGLRDEIASRTKLSSGAAATRRLYRQCDVVLSWGIAAGLQMVSKRPRRAKVVLVSHGVGKWTSRVFARAEGVDGFVAVSEAALQPIPEPYRDSARVIPNAYDPAKLIPKRDRESTRAFWGVTQQGQKVLGYLGRCSPEKNPDALAKALAHLPLEWVGVLVGGGWEHAKAIAAAEAIAPGRVLFPGPTSDVGGALAAFDAMLLPSHEEACSLALLEAWAAGVPVLATRVGIVGEFPDLVRALEIDPSGEAIAVAVLADEADPEGTALRVDRARETALSHFSPAAFGQAWTNYLLEIASSCQKPTTPLTGTPPREATSAEPSPANLILASSTSAATGTP